MPDSTDLVPEPTDDDLERVRTLLRRIGGPNVSWGAKDQLEVLLTERRLQAERIASDRLIRVTLVLALATIVLALATVGLIFATLAE